MIDTFDTLRRNGVGGTEAVLRAGGQRMRPILLTATTTTLGLLPLVLRLNINFIERDFTYNAPSAQWWAQLSTVIVFGLVFATPLTLLVTPSALVYKARLEDRATRRREKRRAKEAALEAEDGLAGAVSGGPAFGFASDGLAVAGAPSGMGAGTGTGTGTGTEGGGFSWASEGVGGGSDGGARTGGDDDVLHGPVGGGR